MKFEIKNRWNGEIKLKIEGESLKAALEIAVGKKADLREANLWGADLREANLWGADLREANLREADLWGADLRGADLREANLWGADLREANLREADLRGADLRGADLWGADLRGADLWGAGLLVLLLPQYTVYVQKEKTRIGCQYRENSDWIKWTPDDVAHMASDASTWWAKYKAIVVEAIKSLEAA